MLLRLLPIITVATAARAPKIYNALISTDENLTPSQAYPVLEPVLRTTALGVAFQPLLYGAQEQGNLESKPPKVTYHGSLYPVTYEPYLQYFPRQEYLYPAPYYQQPVLVDQQKDDNKPAPAPLPPVTTAPVPPLNFKKNPEIPDVPPPPLPVGKSRKTGQTPAS